MQSQTQETEAPEPRIPAISRKVGDTIIELVYDPEKRKTALVVSRFGGLWNTEQEVRIGDETLVPYAAANNLIAHECVLFAAKPEHHGDKTALLADIEAFLNRYVDLSPTFTKIASHYVLLSWVHDAFDELPYVRLQGDYGTGKTRGLLALGLLCYKPFFASGASTVSPIFHILDTFGGTLVLDEADFRFSDATNELVKILNNGTMKGLPVLRTMQNRHRELNPRAFRVFGPKIVAMRGSYQDDALESRFLTEDMNTRHMRADIPFHVPPQLRSEALALRNKLLHFRLTTLFETKINPSLAVPDLEPRLNQIALPLLSIIDDPALRSAICKQLVQQHESSARVRNRQMAEAIGLLLHDIFAKEERNAVPIRELVEKLNSAGETCATKQVARIVRRQLGVAIHKSEGIHVISRTEMRAVKEALAKFGLPAGANPQERVIN